MQCIMRTGTRVTKRLENGSRVGLGNLIRVGFSEARRALALEAHMHLQYRTEKLAQWDDGAISNTYKYKSKAERKEYSLRQEPIWWI